MTRQEHNIILKADVIMKLIRAGGRSSVQFSESLSDDRYWLNEHLATREGSCHIDTARRIADKLNVPLTSIIDTAYLKYLKGKGLTKSDCK